MQESLHSPFKECYFTLHLGKIIRYENNYSFIDDPLSFRICSNPTGTR